MADKLSIYNGALRELGETPLSSLTENRSSRRTLDAFYDDALDYCLEAGFWTFAEKTLKLDYDPSIEPSFGYTRFFRKPDDYVNLCGIWSDGYMQNPLGVAYDEDGQGWYSDFESIYVKYVSNSPDFGKNLNIYPATYKLFVERQLALITCMEITKSETKLERINNLVKTAERNAKNVTARGKPSKRMPVGSWVRARMSGYSRENG